MNTVLFVQGQEEMGDCSLVCGHTQNPPTHTHLCTRQRELEIQAASPVASCKAPVRVCGDPRQRAPSSAPSLYRKPPFLHAKAA